MNSINNYQKYKRIIYIFSVFILSTCYELNAQGPNAPEAASFEPVDATDMVNLVTGNMSYVLPLLEVPSPEGGYPVVLSYHSGIAMDQEASWAGLGWTLNPGAINRSVNGYPDDWGKTHVGEFFYKQAWTEKHYEFSVGGTTPNGITLGLGASWGTNQAFGGIVSLGYVGLSADVGIGANKGFWGARYSKGGVNLGLSSTSGPSVGFSKKIGIFAASYNTSSGLSGGISTSTIKDKKYSRLGINFSSNGVNVSGSANGNSGGVGISNSNSSMSQGNLNISEKTRGLNLDFGAFWVKFRYTKVRYSLFQTNDLFVAGTLYPYATKRSQRNLKHFGEIEDLKYQEFNYAMDTYKVTDKYKGNGLLPSYDNYTVNAQGLSATMQPRTFADNMVIYGNGNFTPFDNAYIPYITNQDRYVSDFNNPNNQYDLGNKTHFYFTNAYNSFLRIDKKYNEVVDRTRFYNWKTGENAFDDVKPIDSEKYNRVTSPDGNKLRTGSRKRGGGYIETFTNEAIRTNTALNFIEATSIENERSNRNSYLDEGIGAYQITTGDGKTYHYSLPVLQYEAFFKSFKNDDPNNDFYEQKKLKPYATHWLLTAITGPDYIDKNSNGKLDANDYGYWVAFDYGKWSDGFGWRGPSAGYNTSKILRNPRNQPAYDDITQSYLWGRKQVFYLDQIKTRTHTALFVKDLREDNMSAEIRIRNHAYVDGHGDFNIVHHGINIISEDREIVSLPGEYFFDEQNETKHMTYDNEWGNVLHYQAFIKDQKYVDLPSSKSLKLSKIILLKNSEINTNLATLKSTGNLTNGVKGRIYINDEFSQIRANVQYHKAWRRENFHYGGALTREKKELKTFNSQIHNNVLDVSDIRNMNLESLAIKTINLNTSYELRSGNTNSTAKNKGSLTLKAIETRGKNGIKYMPPTQFAYEKPETEFKSSLMDNWGYHKETPEAWSLNEITNPLGGKIKIVHESDSYEYSAAGSAYGGSPVTEIFHKYHPNSNQPELNEITSFEKLMINGEEHLKIIYTGGKELENDLRFSFIPGRLAGINFHLYRGRPTVYNTGRSIRLKYLKVIETQGKDWVLLKPTTETDTREIDLLFTQTTPHEEDTYLNTMSLSTYKSVNITDDPNGKKKGGIRVQSIEVYDDAGNSYTTEYDYTNPITNVISGVTSYEPEDTSEDGYDVERTREIDQFISQLPAPGINYEFVTVSTKDKNNALIGYTTYNFDVLKPFEGAAPNGELFTNFIYNNHKRFPEHFPYYISYRSRLEERLRSSIRLTRYKSDIIDKSSHIGRLLSTKAYNSVGQLLGCTTNTYKSELDGDGELSVTQESFLTFLQSQDRHPNTDIQSERWAVQAEASLLSKTYYPSVLESTTTYEEGRTSTTYFDKYDFLTGQVTETRTISSDGTEYLTKVIPAYNISEYNDLNDLNTMGPKVDRPSNSNMLTQVAANLKLVKNGDDWNTINSTITTWNKDWEYRTRDGELESPTINTNKVWRQHQNFIWQGPLDTDGRYEGYKGDFDDFIWADTNSQTNSNWVKSSSTNLYDHYSMPLETEDINGNRASTKMGDNNTKIFATANAAYNQMFYSGAEDLIPNTNYFSGEVYKGNTAIISNNSHTGEKGLQAYENTKAFIVKPYPGVYKVSVWVYKGYNDIYKNTRLKAAGNVINYNNSETVEAGNWVQYNFYTSQNDIILGSEVYIYNSSGTAVYDDFRMHPVQSSMISYVYNNWDELTYVIGANNLATQYVYDDVGRLTCTFSEIINTPKINGGFKLISSNKYKYKGGGMKEPYCGYTQVEDNGLEVTTTTAFSLYPHADFTVYITGKDFVNRYPNVGPDPVEKWEIDYGDGQKITGNTRIHGAYGNATFSHDYASSGNKTIKIKSFNQDNEYRIDYFNFNLEKGAVSTYVPSNDSSGSTTFVIKGKQFSSFTFDLTTWNQGTLILGSKVYEVSTAANGKENTKTFTVQMPASGELIGKLTHTRSNGEAGNYERTRFLITKPYGSSQQAIEDFHIIN